MQLASDGGVPGAGPAGTGAEAIAARLRKAREKFHACTTSGSTSDYMDAGAEYEAIMFDMNERGALERLLEAVQHDIETDMASGYLRETYKRLEENVSDD